MASGRTRRRLAPRASIALAVAVAMLAGLGLAGCGDAPSDPASTAVTASPAPSSILLDDLGIELAAAPADASGALVHSLARNGAHALLRSGDLIVAINGNGVESVADVDRALHGIEIGESLGLTVVRGNRRMSFTEVLSPVAYLGVQVQDRHGGAVVVGIEDRGPAAAAGLRRDDEIVAIDDEPVASASDLLQILGTRSPGDKVTIEIDRDSRRKTLTASLTERPTP